MEKIIKLGGEYDRAKEASTSARIHNQSNNLSSDTTQQKCFPAKQSTTKCDDRVKKHSGSAKINSSRKSFNFKLTMLLQYGKELLGFLALILTTYATLLNKEPVIGGTVSPKAIFPKDSIVHEWPYGHLVDVQSKVAVSELSLIFFYAPWCAESLFAKKVYNSVANLYSREAYFAAVNCWQPNSGCRTNYSNVYKWPVLMAYLPNGFSVQYNGDWSYNTLSTFLERLLMPIVRINDAKELTKLRLANDAVVLGVVNSPNCREYQLYFQTAVKWLESNSFQNVKFAVYIGEKTSMFLPPEEDIQPPVIKLFITNDTIVYNNSEWDSQTILNMLRQNLVKSNIWMHLSSTKSSAMSAHLHRGPVVLMFTPRVPSYHYFIMKQLIYSYTRYQQDLNNTVLNEYITDIQKEYSVKLKKLNQFCELAQQLYYLDIETALYDVGVWDGRLFSLGIQTVNGSKYVTSSPHLSIEGNACGFNSCDAGLMRHYVLQKYGSKFNFDMLDNRSPLEILRSHLQKKCIHLEKIPQTVLQKTIIEPVNPSMMLGTEYVQNKTLTFLMLDSSLYADYLRNFIGEFGIKQYPSLSPALFIIDNNGESLYMQKRPISTRSAMEFLNDFHRGTLRRHLRASAISENLNSSRNSDISIKEINSQEFSKVIHRTNVTSIVLFYSSQCSACFVMSQTLLHVSNILKFRNVQFFRMDASNNDVSWQYTMDKYPTLIVFPQNKTAETFVFPSTLEVNVKNVFGFITSKLKPEQQLKSLINACILTKMSAPFQSCARQVRVTIEYQINRYLLRWNRSPSHRTFILKRLSMLKEVYLELIRAKKGPDLETILRYFEI